MRTITPLSDLSGPPCSSEGILESLGRVISPGDWDKAVDETRRSVCTNYYGIRAGVDCLIAIFPDSDVVCQTLVAYVNLSYERTIPEYKPGAHPTTGQGSPYWPAYEGSVAVDTVCRLTGYGKKLVQEILYELYWATESGRIADGRIAHPWIYRLNSGTLSKQPPNTDLDKNRSLFDADMMTLVRWGGVLALFAVGAYALSGVISTSRTVMSVFRS